MATVRFIDGPLANQSATVSWDPSANERIAILEDQRAVTPEKRLSENIVGKPFLMYTRTGQQTVDMVTFDNYAFVRLGSLDAAAKALTPLKRGRRITSLDDYNPVTDW